MQRDRGKTPRERERERERRAFTNNPEKTPERHENTPNETGARQRRRIKNEKLDKAHAVRCR